MIDLLAIITFTDYDWDWTLLQPGLWQFLDDMVILALENGYSLDTEIGFIGDWKA